MQPSQALRIAEEFTIEGALAQAMPSTYRLSELDGTWRVDRLEMSTHEPTPDRGANLAPMDGLQALIAEQVNYYRHRAAEYDETSQPPGDPLAEYGRELARALSRFRPTGDVLEIASGTGGWTVQLLPHASSIAALDASPEMHEQAAVKVRGDRRVRFVEADVFSWTPDAQYDVVFFANWLSHVPAPLFDTFWDTVGRALRPLGRVFFIDELRDAWRNEELHVDPISGRTLRSCIARCSTVIISES